MADKKQVRKSSVGAWVIKMPGGDILIENSEIRALRLAVDKGGTVKFAEFGHSILNVADTAPVDQSDTNNY